MRDAVTVLKLIVEAVGTGERRTGQITKCLLSNVRPLKSRAPKRDFPCTTDAN